MPNKFFPVSIDLNNKNILVIGAGKIALRKVKTLLDYNCNITIITKEVSEEEFLENTFLVVSATDNKELNDKISKLCMSKNILVNNITSQDNMNLRFMSILSNDDIQISITANGNPKKAVEVKNKIKEFLEKIF